jgi:hypothetical protein
VFLLEKAGNPFGAAEYIGDFTTDQYGNATNTYQLIVEETFAFSNETGSRTDLNSVEMWFADETSDDACLGANSSVTGFDGDGKVGAQMLTREPPGCREGVGWRLLRGGEGRRAVHRVRRCDACAPAGGSSPRRPRCRSPRRPSGLIPPWRSRSRSPPH